MAWLDWGTISSAENGLPGPCMLYVCTDFTVFVFNFFFFTEIVNIYAEECSLSVFLYLPFHFFSYG